MAVPGKWARHDISFPQPETVWDPRNQARRDEMVRQIDRSTHKKGEDIEVGDGRIIIRSPNGARWAVTIDNAGVITALAVS